MSRVQRQTVGRLGGYLSLLPCAFLRRVRPTYHRVLSVPPHHRVDDEYPGVRDDGRILFSGVRGRARAGGRCLDNWRRHGDRRCAEGGDRRCDLEPEHDHVGVNCHKPNVTCAGYGAPRCNPGPRGCGAPLKTPFLIQGPVLVGSSSAPRPFLLDPGRMKPATLTLAGVVVAGSTDGVHVALPVRAWLQLPSLATILAGAGPTGPSRLSFHWVAHSCKKARGNNKIK